MLLMKVPYDKNSPHVAVRECLAMKRKTSAGIAGIGPASCCSYVIFNHPDRGVDNVFGNSRIRIPFFDKSKQSISEQNSAACAHGELTALWNAIEDCDGIPDIKAIYIEMSPCPNCRQALQNLLPPRTIVLYSFNYGLETAAWTAAAAALCR